MGKYECRKSQTVLRFTDAAGQPLKNTAVHAELKNHEFKFGTGGFFAAAVAAGSVNPRHEYYARIYDEWKKVFNYATLPFYCGGYEPVRGKTKEAETLKAVNLLTGDGKSVKGHPLCWHTVVAKWLYELDDADVLKYFLSRIERELSVFGGKIGFWDVINEVVIMPEFCNEPSMNPVTRLCRKLGRVELVKTLFDKAHAVDPNATLLLNDFNTSDRYASLISDCLDAGVGIDVIGIQSHQHQGFWGMEKLIEVTERFERFGKPIHYTENTFVSGDLMPSHIVDLNDWQVESWPSTPEGEARQKNDLMAMMDYLFDRPLVEGFTTWDFEDHGWLKAPSGLIHSNGAPKPALIALSEKLKGDWHTSADLVTDENGCALLNGFRGEYELSSGDRRIRFTLKKGQPEAVLSI